LGYRLRSPLYRPALPLGCFWNLFRGQLLLLGLPKSLTGVHWVLNIDILIKTLKLIFRIFPDLTR
jgi:hypothetical protein